MCSCLETFPSNIYWKSEANLRLSFSNIGTYWFHRYNLSGKSKSENSSMLSL